MEAATAEELAAYWPGGSANPGRDLSAWMHCFLNMGRFLGRTENEGPTEAERQLAEEAAQNALRGEPLEVELVDPAAARRYVFPKSAHALFHLAERDTYLGHLTAQHDRLAAMETAGAVLAKGRVLQEINYQLRVFAWIICHPECGLPFPDQDPRPAPPAWTEALAVFDFPRLILANRTVNGARLDLLFKQLAPPRGDGSRALSWSSLIVAASERLKMPSTRLARDLSLESVIAQVWLGLDAERHEAERTRMDRSAPAFD
jgi:hypothetical protein